MVTVPPTSLARSPHHNRNAWFTISRGSEGGAPWRGKEGDTWAQCMTPGIYWEDVLGHSAWSTVVVEREGRLVCVRPPPVISISPQTVPSLRPCQSCFFYDSPCLLLPKETQQTNPLSPAFHLICECCPPAVLMVFHGPHSFLHTGVMSGAPRAVLTSLRWINKQEYSFVFSHKFVRLAFFHFW